MCRSPLRSSTARRSAGTSSAPELRARRGPRAARAGSRAARGARRPPPRSRSARLAGRVVEDPVLGDVQPAAHRRLAQRHVVGLGAGEVLQQVAELVGLDDAQVDAQAGVRAAARGVVARRRRSDSMTSSSANACSSAGGSLGGGDDVEVLDGVGQAPRRAGQLDAVATPGARAAPRRSPRPISSAVCSSIARRRASRRRRRRTRRAPPPRTSRRSPRTSRSCCGLGGGAQRVERVDPELVEEPARALGPEARAGASCRQPGRELRAQPLERRDRRPCRAARRSSPRASCRCRAAR